MCVSLLEAQGTAYVSLASLGWTLACQGTCGAYAQLEAGDKGFLLTAGDDGHGLRTRAGDLDRLAVRRMELDHEIGQMQLVRVGGAPTNGCLDVFDGLAKRTLFYQDLIGLRAAIASIGVQRFEIGPCVQVGQRFDQELVVIGVVRSHLHLDDQLQFVLWVTGFGDIGDVALVTLPTFLALGSFQVVGGLQAGGAQFLVDLDHHLRLLEAEVFAKDTH